VFPFFEEKKMKKLTSLLLVILLITLSLASCSSGTGMKKQTEKELEKRALALLSEMTSEEAYLNAYSNILLQYEDLAEKLSGCSFEKPVKEYRIDIDEDTLYSCLGLLTGGKMSDELSDYMQKGAYSALASVITIAAGTDAVAVSSIFTASVSGYAPGLKSNEVRLCLYENEVAVIVIMHKNAEGYASVTARPVFCGLGTDPTTDEITAAFGSCAKAVTGISKAG